MIGQCRLFAFLAVVLLNGVTDALPPQKIIGGSPAAIGEFPYLVSLRFRGQHLCGGSIIGERHILTAAHCVARIVQRPYTDLVIVTGTIWSSRGQTHVVKSVHYHAQYNPQSESSPDDIAIISLVNAIRFNANQRSINLATSATPSGAIATAAGWGLTNAQSRTTSEQLLKVQVRTLAPAECQKYLAGTSTIYNYQICTRDAPGRGVCQGDSGGPLVYNGQVIGVVSYGIPCGLGYPDVYTSVFHYVSWIRQVVANL